MFNHRKDTGGPRVLISAPDKLPEPEQPANFEGQGPLDKDAGGRFQRGNKFAKLSRLKAGPKVLARMDTCDPEMREWLTWAKRYIRRRKVELAKISGGEISAGVAAMVQASGMSYASSYFTYQQGVKLGDVDMLKKSSAMAVEARQQDLAAYELSMREAKARPAKSPHELLKEALAVEAEVAPSPSKPNKPAATAEVLEDSGDDE